MKLPRLFGAPSEREALKAFSLRRRWREAPDEVKSCISNLSFPCGALHFPSDIGLRPMSSEKSPKGGGFPPISYLRRLVT